jgi:hypothetical protein
VGIEPTMDLRQRIKGPFQSPLWSPVQVFCALPQRVFLVQGTRFELVVNALRGRGPWPLDEPCFVHALHTLHGLYWSSGRGLNPHCAA